jgi:hypothetical protein
MAEEVLAQETLPAIQDRYRRARMLVGPWHGQIKRWRDFYDQTHYKVRAKVNETQYPDPTPTNVVDVAVGVLGSHPLEFKAVGWKPSPEEQTDTENVEKFLNGAIDVANDREDMLIPYMVNLYMVRDGAAVVKSVWDPYLAKRHAALIKLPNPDAEVNSQQFIEMRAFLELPLKTQVIDPLEMYVVPGGRQRWLYLFHVTKMSVHDAETLYGFKDSTFNGREHEKLYVEYELVDYWRVAHYPDMDVIINAVMYNEKFIPGYEPRVMRGYEELPFTLGFFKPVDLKDPAKWGHGVIRPLEPSVLMLERNINRRQRQIDVYSSLPMFTKSLPGRSVTVDSGFGKSVSLSIDEEIGFPTWPGNAPDSEIQIEYLRSRLQQSGFSDILFGMEGQGAGFAISQMTDQNRIRLIEPIRQIELFWSKWAHKALKLVRNFAGHSMLRVYGTFKGENFADQMVGADIADYKVTAKIKAEFPNQQVVNAALSTQSADVLSLRTRAERYWDVDQPGDEWQQRMMEMAEQHPMMINYGIMAELQKRAGQGDQAAAMVVQMMMNPQGAQNGGRPTEPGGPPAKGNMLGTASATGELPPQATGGPVPGDSVIEQAGALGTAAPGMDGSIGGYQ